MNRIKSKPSKDAGSTSSSDEKKRKKMSKRSASSSSKRKLEMILIVGILLQLYFIFRTSDLRIKDNGKATKMLFKIQKDTFILKPNEIMTNHQGEQNESTNIQQDVRDVQGKAQGFVQNSQGSQNVKVVNEENNLMLQPHEILAKYEGQVMDTLAGGTERTKSIIAARLGLMEASTDIVGEMSKINISIVVSHCEENVKWIANYVGSEYSIKDITIYSKCGKEVRGLKELQERSSATNVVRLPNVGRCDHTYANWIQEHYSSIVKERDGNDIVMFLKDHARYRRKYLPINLLFSQVSKSGFACVTKPICDCNKKCLNGFHIPTMQHKRDYLLDFSLHEYKRVDRDENSVFLSDQYKSLKEWNEKMGFIIPQSETIPVCYGGIFAAQKKQLLNQSEESWKKMESSLSRADNIIEGHYAERLWASVLSDVNIDSAMAVDEVLSPHIVKMVRRPKGDLVCGMAGMLYVHKNAQITVPGA